jgi:hypothetical protein
MVSLRLRHALRRPPTRNPLFKRAFIAPEQPAPWYIGCVQWAGIALFLPIIALAALIYGIGWSVGIANLISKERAQGTFDLISLCPSGPLGMSWAIATGYLYHHRTFKNINAPGNLYSRVATMAVFTVALGLLFDLQNAVGSGHLLFALMARIVALAFALYADHVQSLVLAALAGIAAGGMTSNRVNAQLYALVMNVGIQLVTYLATIAIGFSLLPAILDVMNLHSSLAETVVVGARLLIFVGTREALTALLWSVVHEQLNPDAMETRLLTQSRASITGR